MAPGVLHLPIDHVDVRLSDIRYPAHGSVPAKPVKTWPLMYRFLHV